MNYYLEIMGDIDRTLPLTQWIPVSQPFVDEIFTEKISHWSSDLKISIRYNLSNIKNRFKILT